jgi:hypothetical protein
MSNNKERGCAEESISSFQKILYNDHITGVHLFAPFKSCSLCQLETEGFNNGLYQSLAEKTETTKIYKDAKIIEVSEGTVAGSFPGSGCSVEFENRSMITVITTCPPAKGARIRIIIQELEND